MLQTKTKNNIKKMIGLTAVIFVAVAVANFIIASISACDVGNTIGRHCSVTTTQTNAIIMLMAAFALSAILVRLTKK